MDRPVTTLFLLMSVDGKISTGASDELDVDRDFPLIPGVREGLHQYYEIEQTTDLWSLNSGRVQAKIGVNEREMPEKTAVSFVVVDNGRMGQVFWSGTFLRWQISFPGGSSEPLNRYESKDLLVK